MTRVNWRAAFCASPMLLSVACGGDDKAAVNTVDGGESTVSQSSTAADGGLVAQPTWYEHVQPLVHQHCSGCHRPGQIAPFSMLDYDSVKPFASLMAQAVEDGRMPPFMASETADCTPKHKYKDDTRLNADQKKLLRAWADSGAPAGDPAKAGALVEPPVVSLDREDIALTIPEPITVQDDGKGDLHTCLVLDPKFPADTYITGAQITAGNTKVLHHVVQYVIKTTLADGTVLTRDEMLARLKAAKGVGVNERYACFGSPSLDDSGLQIEMIGAWAPGATPVTGPDNSGQPVKKDSLVVLDMHYHPVSSGPEIDTSTKFSLRLASTVPKYIAYPVFQGYADPKAPVHLDAMFGVEDLLTQPGEAAPIFDIPPGEAKHVEEWQMTWRLAYGGLRVYFAGTHAHYVAQDIQVHLLNNTPRPGEDPVECLVQTPHWDFNWQAGYSWDVNNDYNSLPQLDDGDTIKVKCVYNNTLDNALLAKALDDRGLSAPIDVKIGEDTLDEMCLATLGITYPNPAYTGP